MPIRTREVDRICKEDGLVERDIEFKSHNAREASFGKNQVAAACSAADCKIARAGTNFGKCVCDRTRCYKLLVGRKTRFLTARGVNHVAAEQHYLLRRRVGLISGHHIKGLKLVVYRSARPKAPPKEATAVTRFLYQAYRPNHQSYIASIGPFVFLTILAD